MQTKSLFLIFAVLCACIALISADCTEQAQEKCNEIAAECSSDLSKICDCFKKSIKCGLDAGCTLNSTQVEECEAGAKFFNCNPDVCTSSASVLSGSAVVAVLVAAFFAVNKF